jgi:hypothetical protein
MKRWHCNSFLHVQPISALPSFSVDTALDIATSSTLHVHDFDVHSKSSGVADKNYRITSLVWPTLLAKVVSTAAAGEANCYDDHKKQFLTKFIKLVIYALHEIREPKPFKKYEVLNNSSSK